MLARLKAKLVELEDSRPKPMDDVFTLLVTPEERFKAYELAYADHVYKEECIKLAIHKVETATKISYALSLI